MSYIGGYNPSANRFSASQQVQSIQGAQAPAATPSANSTTNPLFGRPGIDYTGRVSTSQAGPIPRMSVGSGRTGVASDRSTGFVPTGNAGQQDYQPQGLEYSPLAVDAFSRPNMPPRTVNLGNNGRELVGTYEPHDFTPVQRFFHNWRAASNWQSIAYGPNWRNLLIWQQVQKYNLFNAVAQSRPLSQTDYFLGYVTPAGTNVSSPGMGASGGTLGYR